MRIFASTNNKSWRGCGKRELFYTASGNVNSYSHYGEQNGESSKKKTKQTEFTFDPVIPSLGIYPEKNMVLKETCTPRFTAALFTIAKTWKQPKCPLTEEWLKKM